jgi:prolipoprotein diacylglyceryltransferase
VQDAISFGPFIINVKWLMLAISGMFGYIVLKFRLKWMKSVNKVIQEEVINSLVIIPLVWKLSLILFHPVKFVRNPVTIIYFSGGTLGFQLALAAAAVYLLYSSKKQKISIWIYADTIAAGFLAGSMLFNLIIIILSKQFVLFYLIQIVLTAFLLLWQLKKFKIIGKKENLNQLLLWFSLGQILSSYFKTQDAGFQNSILGFTLEQFLYYSLAIFAIVISLVSGKKTNYNR